MNAEDEFNLKHEQLRLRFSYTVLISVSVVCGLIMLTFFYLIVSNPLYLTKLMDYIFEQAEAVIGIPFCAAMALYVVLMLRTTQGPGEFEGIGFKFRGASGPIVMFVLCFLAFVGATRLLWS